VIVRLEEPGDESQIRTVNELAFESPVEANLVDKLRRTCTDALSLVAEDGGQIVGHILFTLVVLEQPEKIIRGMGLAPMAVLPAHQHQGIGSEIVKHGLEILRESGCSFVIVLGHPEYYPRFGFVPASRYNIQCQWENVPQGAFMIIVYDEAVIQGVSGVARYRDEFNEAL